jgi:hypothetical protein
VRNVGQTQIQAHVKNWLWTLNLLLPKNVDC